MRHLSFLLKRKTVNCDQYKITGELTDIQFAINIHYPSYPISLLTYEEPPSFPNSTYDGGITMYASRRAMNIKRPSKHAMDSLSPQSCSLASVTRQQPSKQ